MKKVIASIIIVLIVSLSVSVYAVNSGTVTTSDLNVRAGAGTNFNSIAKLNNGDKVTILSEEGDWYKIQFNGKEGYVNKKYVTKNSDENSSTSDNTSSSESTSNKTKLISDSTLYVLPLLNSTKIGQLKNGDEVILVSVNNSWAYVYTENNSGWIFAKNLESTEIKIGDNSEESSNAISENTVETNDVSENIVANETENTISNSTNTVTENENTTNTATDSNTTETTNTVNNTTNSNTVSEDKSNIKYPVIMYVNVTSAYVRSSADASSSIVTSVGKNTSVRVISASGDWYKVETGSGNGYMKSSLLSLSKN